MRQPSVNYTQILSLNHNKMVPRTIFDIKHLIITRLLRFLINFNTFIISMMILINNKIKNIPKLTNFTREI